MAGPYRNRVRELRNVKASELRRNESNWREHGANQSAALRQVLETVGFASAVIARELDDGSIEIIDGHLRADTMDDAEVPVLIVDVDDAEAATLLATMDPIAGMASTNQELLHSLMQRMKSVGPDLDARLKQMSAQARSAANRIRKESGSAKSGQPSEKSVSATATAESASEGSHQRQRIPLSIVLKKDEYDAWNSYRESNSHASDREALLALLGFNRK